jgi:hypothetical protein
MTMGYLAGRTIAGQDPNYATGQSASGTQAAELVGA